MLRCSPECIRLQMACKTLPARRFQIVSKPSRKHSRRPDTRLERLSVHLFLIAVGVCRAGSIFTMIVLALVSLRLGTLRRLNGKRQKALIMRPRGCDVRETLLSSC